MSDTNIVPFGKYKGRPIEEVIETDPSYLHWLAGQDWFRARYVSLHQTIINRGAEPEETPEHNALQALFLDDDFCARFIVARHKIVPEQQRQEALNCAKREKWQKEIDTLSATGEFKIEIVRREFEELGIDVCLKTHLQYNEYILKEFSAGIEIKPTVGDDYPAILRQIKRLQAGAWRSGRFERLGWALFLESYTGTGATAEQMTSMFQTAGIAVVYRRDCEQ